MRQIIPVVHKALVLLMLLTSVMSLNAQNCNLESARLQFSLGQFEKVVQTLGPCCEKKPAVEEACELLVKAQLEIENEERADSAYQLLLKANPFYEVKLDEEPYSDLYWFSKNYWVNRFSFGVKSGVMIARPESYRTYSLLSGESKQYQAGTGLVTGVYLNVPIWKKIHLQIEGVFEEASYNYSSELFFNATNVIGAFTFRERQRYFSTPITLHFDTRYIYCYVGAEINFLNSTVLEELELNLDGSQETLSFSAKREELAIDLSREEAVRRNRNMSLLAGLGLKYAFPPKPAKLEFVLDFRVKTTLDTYVNKTNRYQNEILLHEFQYIDDDLRLFALVTSLSIRYYWNTVKRK
jgi:hypothetical protein